MFLHNLLVNRGLITHKTTRRPIKGSDRMCNMLDNSYEFLKSIAEREREREFYVPIKFQLSSN